MKNTSYSTKRVKMTPPFDAEDKQKALRQLQTHKGIRGLRSPHLWHTRRLDTLWQIAIETAQENMFTMDTADALKRIYKEVKEEALAIRPVDVSRSIKRQNELRKKGVSKAAWIEARHVHCLAFDLVHATELWKPSMKQHHWEALRDVVFEATRGREYKIRWGADWNGNGITVTDDPHERFYDPAHFELSQFKINTRDFCDYIRYCRGL